MTTATLSQQGEVRRPQPKQARFLSATEDEVLYGGAAFGGKTESLLMFTIRRREKYPGSAGLLLRRTFQDLNKEGALIPRSKEILWGKVHWSEQYHKWTFGNGSVIQFGYLDNPDDHLHYQGTIWEDIGWEELTQFPSEQKYEYVNSFCRSRFPECKPLKRATTNPGGPGHGWVKARFIDVAPWGEPYVYEAGGGTETRLFIPARAEDNPVGLAKDPEYVNRLQALPEPLRSALWEGSWDVFEGQVFANWRRDLHVCEPFGIPQDWTRWVGIDYGFAAPFCCLWAARPPDKKRIVIYRELYATGWRAREQALRIKAASERENISMYAADPSMWQHRHETVGISIADEYAEAGVRLTKANNDRKAGLEAMRQALDWRALPGGRLLKEPRLQVFSTCTNFIRTIPALPYDSIKVEDVCTEAEDHCLIAETKVTTHRGEMSISKVRPGDEVLTRDGWRLVLRAWQTQPSASLLAVSLSNERMLVGTGAHRVWCKGEWKRLDTLGYGDILQAWSSSSVPRSNSLKASDTISAGNTSSARADDSIASCGRRITVLCRKAPISIIATMTAATIRWRTWCLKRVQNIRGIMGVIQAKLLGQPVVATSSAPTNGIAPRLALSGIGNTLSAPSSAPFVWSRPVRSAAASIPAAELMSVGLGSVQTPASPVIGGEQALITRTAPAPAADNRSERIGSDQHSPAAVYVLGVYDAGRAPVYNLTVEGCPEFYAEGVLVHNCYDASRYLLMAERRRVFEPEGGISMYNIPGSR